VYLEALEHEHEARSKHERLLSDLGAAEKNVCLLSYAIQSWAEYAISKAQTLQQACSKRVRLELELDALYERIFSGPTPGQYSHASNPNA
jgi:hypothetical protein